MGSVKVEDIDHLGIVTGVIQDLGIIERLVDGDDPCRIGLFGSAATVAESVIHRRRDTSQPDQSTNIPTDTWLDISMYGRNSPGVVEH